MIIVYTCGSCDTVLTYNTCYTGTVERFGEYILEQSGLVRAVPELTVGAQWLSGRVLDSRPKGREFEPHRRHCVVVLEQHTFILA